MRTGFDPEQSEFDNLSVAQQERLSELLDTYLACLERGEPVDREQLIARNPDLAEPIRLYLESLEFLQDAAVGFVPSASSDDASQGESERSDDQYEKRIGDFRILAEIGRGGMGIVYEAWQISLDRRVALKVLPFASLLDGKQISRFRNEAQAAARLHHTNIVPVFAVGTDRGVHYYAMQFIEGQPLDRVIEATRLARKSRGQSVPSTPDASQSLTSTYTDDTPSYFRSVARLGMQAAAALHAAHEEGIVHRDVKPSNLLLDVEGKLWVADFGLARCRADSELTRSGDLVGTMRYMSPEQARGSAAIVDHRSDVYSLGITLYELLTLRQAVRGADAAAIIRQLDRDEPFAPGQWDPTIPRDLETIVSKAIAKSPDGRYATAQALADDLQRFLSGQPIQARRPTFVDRLGKWIARHKRMVAVAACVMLVALVGLAIGTVLLTRQSHRTAEALTAAQDNFQQYRRQLARTTNHVAMLQEQQGDARAAAASFEEAARLQREILAERPTDAVTLRDLSVTLNNLGVFLTRSDIPRAASAYGESIDALRRLAELAPADDAVRRDLALALSNLGSHHRRHRNPRRAVERFEEARSHFERLAASEPLSLRDAYDLAVVYNNLGMAQTDLDQLQAAQDSFVTALRATQRPTAADSAEPTAGQRSAVGGIYYNLGLVQEKQQRLREAAESFTLAIRFQRQALRDAPQVERFCELLDQHYLRGARIMRTIGNYRQAEEWIAARQALRPRDPRHLWSVAEEWALLARAASGMREGDRSAPLAAPRHAAAATTAVRKAIGLGLQADREMVESELAKMFTAADDGADDVRAWLATATASS